METTVEFKVWGRMALFSDPITRIGGEKCSYSVPTYEALRGVLESIYWKPTITWVVDKVRVMNKIKTQPRSAKLHKLNGSTDLSIYTYLSNVCYQVQAHFEFNPRRRGEFSEDWSCIKHLKIMRRAIEKGGRRDIFLGTRECQGYVEPVSLDLVMDIMIMFLRSRLEQCCMVSIILIRQVFLKCKCVSGKRQWIKESSSFHVLMSVGWFEM